jgi:hypothetical protein
VSGSLFCYIRNVPLYAYEQAGIIRIFASNEQYGIEGTQDFHILNISHYLIRNLCFGLLHLSDFKIKCLLIFQSLLHFNFLSRCRSLNPFLCSSFFVLRCRCLGGWYDCWLRPLPHTTSILNEGSDSLLYIIPCTNSTHRSSPPLIHRSISPPSDGTSPPLTHRSISPPSDDISPSLHLQLPHPILRHVMVIFSITLFMVLGTQIFELYTEKTGWYRLQVRCFFSFLFFSILFYSILFYSFLFYSFLFYSFLFYSFLFFSFLFYSFLFYSFLFFSFLFFSFLFFSFLFYSFLFYSFLFFSILSFPFHSIPFLTAASAAL